MLKNKLRRESMLHKIQIYITAMTLLLVFALHAGDIARIGTASGVQVLQPVGAKGIAVGGANIATTSSVDAIFWNPAGLSHMQGAAEGHFSTMNIFGDIRVNYLALGFNMGDLGTAGVSVKAFDFGEIPLTTVEDYDGAQGRTFSPTFATIALTYAISLTDKVNVGLTSKLIVEQVPRAEASAFAFDIGLQYSSFASIQGLSFGIAIKNIGTDMQYEGSGLTRRIQTDRGFDYLSYDAASNDLPGSFEIGLTYDLALNEENSLSTSSIFQNNNFFSDAVKVGLEYTFQDMVMLRGGYSLLTEINSNDQLYDFSLGAGLKYNLAGTDLMFDYAFRNDQYFDAGNVFSLTIGF
jgi:hypothetical protein